MTCPPWPRERHAALVSALYTSRWRVTCKHLAQELGVVEMTIRRWAKKGGMGRIIGGRRMFTDAEAEVIRGGK